nr:dUTP diphosphatase [uncultured Trichococcus sp.]
MKINFKKLSSTAITPKKANYNDAGFDLYADEDITLEYGETKAIATNIALELPDGYMADVRPRSGLTRDTALRVHYGTVDAGYRGGVGIICENASGEEARYSDAYSTAAALAVFTGKDNEEVLEKANKHHEKSVIKIKRGDKIAQLVIQKIPDVQLVEVDELNDTVRGVGGFGSTGK